MSAGGSNNLERFVQDLAKGQPLRRAPARLEARVLSEIGSRQSGGFIHWRWYAQAAFLLSSLGFTWLAIAGAVRLTAVLGAGEFIGSGTLHQGARAVSTTVFIGDLLLHAIPATWLYGAAAVGFILYAFLFGLGTVAYRTLYVRQ